MATIKDSKKVTLLDSASAPTSASVVNGLYSKVTLQVTVTSINTNITVDCRGSNDGTNYGILTPTGSVVTGCAIATGVATITANGTYVLVYEGRTDWFRANWIAETGGTSAVVSAIALFGN